MAKPSIGQRYLYLKTALPINITQVLNPLWLSPLWLSLGASSLLLPNFAAASHHGAAEVLPLMLAKHYQQQDNISDYWVSEKLDGVRAFWNGQQLKTRRGHIIHAPKSFLAALPKVALDGELWLGRRRFAELSGLVRQQTPDEQEWSKVQYRIFDLPEQLTPFDQRYADIQHLCEQIGHPWLQPVKQKKLPSRQALNIYLQQLTDAGAEGLMLHRGSALHQVGRSDDLLKVKLYEDAEAVVLGYTQGKGQYQNMMGALRVRLANGREMKIGSGFSREERQSPPPIGSTITYRFNGSTATGLPRFARFMRIRPD